MPDRERILGTVDGDRQLHVAASRQVTGEWALCGAGQIATTQHGKIESNPLLCEKCRELLAQQS